MSSTDPRRRIPRTDALLAEPAVAAFAARGPVSRERAKALIAAAQDDARVGRIGPQDVAPTVVAALERTVNAPGSSLRPVLNATGIVVHTNLGRAPLGGPARAALDAAAGYTDVELDLDTGRRARRGAGAEDALREAVPAAAGALPVNNGAAALLLAVTALAARHRETTGCAEPEVVVSRGELVEIGAGFRLPELMASTGVRLREVGTTNRTHLADYGDAVTAATAAVIKIHPANYRIEGFTSAVDAAALADLHRPDGSRVPLVVDIGSGLLHPDPALPDEPDATSALRSGADLVTCSGDKLLGGPQVGLVLGDADAVQTLRRHPLARAVRVDKLTLAALEATLQAAAEGVEAPVTRYRRLGREDVRARTEALAAAVGGEVSEVDGHVGGGGAPGVPLPGLAVALPGPADAVASALRRGEPAVLARVAGGRCLVDLRCIQEAEDAQVERAILEALATVDTSAVAASSAAVTSGDTDSDAENGET